MRSEVLLSLVLSWVLWSKVCSGGDNLKAGQKISEDSRGEPLVASTARMEIWWYKVHPKAIGPLDFKGSSSSTNTTVKLLDSGNLVLIGTSCLWQSFQNPTDTFLPGMKMDAKFNVDFLEKRR
ncbi:G-type lectin S-receptor-like serine/threonine-protein kinase, partial [Mucuna pruriens]